MRNRATIRVSAPLILERLFGRDFAQRVKLEVISSERDAGEEPVLVLHISGAPDEVPEGECLAIFQTVEAIDGRATIFTGLQKRS